MKGKRRVSSAVRAAWSGVHLVDKSLVVFMLVLLVQSVYTIFCGGSSGSVTGDIDIIVRTSSAAIFGYFLSSNFMRRSYGSSGGNVSTGGTQITAKNSGSGAPVGRIGFAAEETEQEPGGASGSEKQGGDKDDPCRIQVVVASFIGIFCLVTLLVLRNAVRWCPELGESATVTATVSQFRDYVSGCVGFLIGSPTRDQ